MLQRHAASGAATWIAVIGTVLSQVGEGWGRWAEGAVQNEDEDMPTKHDSDDEDDETVPHASVSAPLSKQRRHVRPSLPTNIQPKLLLLASASHLSTLSDLMTSPTSKAPTTLLVDFATFALGLLNAFRGSPRWEGILDALIEGQKGRVLGRRLWREGVRGRWRNTGERGVWDTFFESEYALSHRHHKLIAGTDPSTPCLLFLTHLYNHYLLLTPDDEFFSDTSLNPISLDEVLELAGIWRDLAFWGYMNGVAPISVVPAKGFGTEETRALFTRGVTRVAERK